MPADRCVGDRPGAVFMEGGHWAVPEASAGLPKSPNPRQPDWAGAVFTEQLGHCPWVRGRHTGSPPARDTSIKGTFSESSQAAIGGWMPLSASRRVGLGAKGIGVFPGGRPTTHTSPQPDRRAALWSL